MDEKEEQEIRRLVQAGWRSMLITRIASLNGRRVGDLSATELEWADKRWMAQIRPRWFEIDMEVKRHYFGLEAALQSLRSSLPDSDTPPKRGLKLPMPGRTLGMSEAPEISAQPPLPPIGTRKSTVSNTLGSEDDSSEREDLHQQEAAATISEEEASPRVVEQTGGELHREDKQSEDTPREPTGPSEESRVTEVFRLQTREDVMWELERHGTRPAQDTALEILEAAGVALKQATHFDEAKRLSDTAEVLRTCAVKLDMAKVVQDEATAFAIRAEHRYNELVQAARERGEIAEGTRGQLRGRKPSGEPNITVSPRSGASGGSDRPLEKTSGVPEVPPEKPPTLAQIGIDKNKARRLHRWTGISEQKLEDLIEEKRKVGKLTKTAVLIDPETPKKEAKSYQPLLSFLKDLEKHPESYDVKILADDLELFAAYDQGRAQLHALIEQLDNQSGEV